MLKRMRDGGVPPDVTTYTTILSGCKRDVDWKRAEALLAEMDSVGIKPNSRTLTAVLKVCVCVCVFFISIVRANRLTNEKTSACSGEETYERSPKCLDPLVPRI